MILAYLEKQRWQHARRSLSARAPSVVRDHRNDHRADGGGARRPDSQCGYHVGLPRDRSPGHAGAPHYVRRNGGPAYSDRDLLQLLRSRVHRCDRCADAGDGHGRDNRRAPYVKSQYDHSLARECAYE